MLHQRLGTSKNLGCGGVVRDVVEDDQGIEEGCKGAHQQRLGVERRHGLRARRGAAEATQCEAKGRG
jgi:hypothetical protein